MLVPASFLRFHLCNTLTWKVLQTLMSMCCTKRLQSRHSFALAALLGQEWFVPCVCSTEQYQTLWLEVIDIPRARLMKTLWTVIFIILPGEAIFLEFPHIVSSAVWFRTQALLKKAEGSALDSFFFWGGWGWMLSTCWSSSAQCHSLDLPPGLVQVSLPSTGGLELDYL